MLVFWLLKWRVNSTLTIPYRRWVLSGRCWRSSNSGRGCLKIERRLANIMLVFWLLNWRVNSTLTIPYRGWVLPGGRCRSSNSGCRCLRREREDFISKFIDSLENVRLDKAFSYRSRRASGGLLSKKRLRALIGTRFYLFGLMTYGGCGWGGAHSLGSCCDYVEPEFILSHIKLVVQSSILPGLSSSDGWLV